MPRKHPVGPVGHESPVPGPQPPFAGLSSPPGTWQSQGNSPHSINCPHFQMALAWGFRGGTRVHISRGKPRPTPPWLSGDHGTLSPGQERTQAKKAEIEQTDGQAGRGKGGAESVFLPEKTPAAHTERRPRQEPHIKCDLIPG